MSEKHAVILFVIAGLFTFCIMLFTLSNRDKRKAKHIEAEVKIELLEKQLYKCKNNH